SSKRDWSSDVCSSDLLWDPLRRGDTAWLKRELDAGAMDAEAITAVGLRNFGSFCRPREHSTTIREVISFSFSRGDDGVVTARITADAFCHHMVRALIGACIEVGQRRRPPGWLMDRLNEPVWDHRVRLAPPQGLVLEQVHYPATEQLAARAEQTRARRA